MKAGFCATPCGVAGPTRGSFDGLIVIECFGTHRTGGFKLWQTATII
jgi:hypothetical protein